MAANKHSICRALLLATCLLLAATAADAGRPLKVSSSSSYSSEGGDAGPQLQTVESPPVAVGYIIKTVVVGTAAEQQGRGAAGHRSMSVDMLGGIKPQGPSPGDGH